MWWHKLISSHQILKTDTVYSWDLIRPGWPLSIYFFKLRGAKHERAKALAELQCNFSISVIGWVYQGRLRRSWQTGLPLCMQPALHPAEPIALHQKLLVLSVAESELHVTFRVTPAVSLCSWVCKHICDVWIGTARAAALTLLVEEASSGKDSTRTCRKPRPPDIYVPVLRSLTMYLLQLFSIWERKLNTACPRGM